MIAFVQHSEAKAILNGVKEHYTFCFKYKKYIFYLDHLYLKRIKNMAANFGDYSIMTTQSVLSVLLYDTETRTFSKNPHLPRLCLRVSRPQELWSVGSILRPMRSFATGTSSRTLCTSLVSAVFAESVKFSTAWWPTYQINLSFRQTICRDGVGADYAAAGRTSPPALLSSAGGCSDARLRPRQLQKQSGSRGLKAFITWDLSEHKLRPYI